MERTFDHVCCELWNVDEEVGIREPLLLYSKCAKSGCPKTHAAKQRDRANPGRDCRNLEINLASSFRMYHLVVFLCYRSSVRPPSALLLLLPPKQACSKETYKHMQATTNDILRTILVKNNCSSLLLMDCGLYFGYSSDTPHFVTY